MPIAIAIHQFAPADAEPIHAAVAESVEQLRPWMPTLGSGLTLENLRTFAEHAQTDWEEGNAYHHAITAAEGGRHLGGVGLTQINRNHMFGNVYYWVRSSAAGQGVASTAVRQLARFAFDQVGVRRLEILMAIGNDASKRAAEKAGATFEGQLRDRLMMYNVWHDAYMFSLIPADLEVPNQS